MNFGDLKTKSGIAKLNSYLEDKSYVEGYVPSQTDNVVFDALSGPPDFAHTHARRWYNHIASYNADERSSFVGVKKPISDFTGGAASASAADEDDDDDDDIDLFGSDEEADAAAEKLKAERAAEYAAKKNKKPGVVAKSNIILDVKPWDDETDMADIEKHVRSIVADGLLWGSSKLVPVGYGIKKLQISCVVEDDKIGTDFLEEEITKNEDLVQSVDVAAFNKI
ncbi:elongation factor 1-beta-like [Corticium candelabrum]|uniref:elongation factor 1-beta-like n=1 Tax=Corticium candelabrum TaxID=121492 RepID=UPI002E2665BE|nr:elongation factor 1-beta-like [Corticium candelabrum]